MISRQPGVEYLPSWQPERIPRSLAEAVVRRTGRPAYTRTSMGFELAAARRMLLRPRSIYHVLYGEDDYHLLSRAAPVLRRLGGRLMASFHQAPAVFDEVVPAACARRILPRLDAAAVSTTEQAEHLARWMPRARIHRVPHGVDTAFFTPAVDARHDGKPFTLITVGEWQRDYDLLEHVVRAFAEREQFVRFLVVSTPAVTARFAGLPGVEVHTRVSDERLRELYQHSDALYLPLVQAAANNTLLEAMACGLPVLATALPGIREYAGPACARLIAGHDLTPAIAEISRLAADPGTRAELGRRARERALEFDWQASAARLSDVYRATV